MAEPLDPTASWPRHLQASWRDCAERGEVDGQNPPDNMIEAYLLVAEVRTKRNFATDLTDLSGASASLH